MEVTPIQTETSGGSQEGEESSRAHSFLRILFWGGLFVVSLLLFTVLKLPEQPVRELLLGQANQALGAMSLRMDAEKSRISLWLGPRYTLESVTLTPLESAPLAPGESATRKLGDVSLSPRFLPLFLGRQAARVHVSHDPGDLDLSFSMGSDFLSVLAAAEAVDLGKTPYLELFGGFRATGRLDLAAAFEGQPSQPETLEGTMRAAIARLALPPQSIRGFRIPSLQISDARMTGEMKAGKLEIRELALGKPGGADDLSLTGSGELTAGRTLYGTKIALKLKLHLSRKLLDAIPLLDGILGPSRKAEGQYAFELVGPLTSPSMNPLP